MTSIINEVFRDEIFREALKACALDRNTKYQNFLTWNTLLESLHQYGVCNVKVTICLDHKLLGRDCREITLKVGGELWH